MNGVDIEAIRNIPAGLRGRVESLVRAGIEEGWLAKFFEDAHVDFQDMQGEELKEALGLAGYDETDIWVRASNQDHHAFYWVHRQITALGAEYEKLNAVPVSAWLDQQMDGTSANSFAKDFFKGLFASLASKPLNVLVVGEVGAGKSSTINALFSCSMAEVGQGAAPKTNAITKYDLGNLTLWDTPGFGNGRRQDEENARSITELMREPAPDGAPLIDLVLLIIDGASKNLGVAYDMIDIVAPALGETAAERIIVAINKADVVAHDMEKDSSWKWGELNDFGSSGPSGDDAQEICSALDDLNRTTRERIAESCQIETDPFCFSAGPTPPGRPSKAPYNAIEVYRRILVHNLADARPALRAMMTHTAARREAEPQ